MTWPDLLRHADLIESATTCRSFDDPSTVARLRRLGSADQVRAAIDLVAARRKAFGRLVEPDAWVADPVGVEQATSTAVARHKAKRFATLAPGPTIIDLCCGIGGDAVALAEVGPTVLIDRDADRLWAARHNVERIAGRRCDAAVADVTTLDLDRVRAFHLDPERRDARGRRHRYEDYRPGPGFIAGLVERGVDGAAKLGPGVEVDALPPGEVEFISESGRLVQAVLWCGRLAGGERSATVLPAGATLSGKPGRAPVAPLGRYLSTVDPAVERAGLIGALCEQLQLAAIHPALGALTSAEPIDSPYLTAFEVRETMPWRPRKVKAWLDGHDGGIVEVKTRGKAVDPDIAARQLRGDGETTYTVFVYRYDERVVAHVGLRLGAGG